MKHWKKVWATSPHYKVEFDGKFEEESCIEAMEGDMNSDGYIVREWSVDGTELKRKKLFGKVFIVRVN